MSTFIETVKAPNVAVCLRRDPVAGTETFPYFQKTEQPYGPTCVRTTNTNPSYRIQIAKMQEAGRMYGVQKMFANLTKSSCATTCFRGVYKGQTEDSYHMGVDPSFPNTFPSSDTGLQDLALQRLKRKLKKRAGGADALVPVLESRELRGLVRQATTMTTTLVETLIDIKRTKGASALKYASNAWLAYGFGIRPLVEDTKAVALAIGDYFTRSGSGIRESGSAKKTWVTHGSDVSAGIGPLARGARLRCQTTFHHSLSYRWYCGGRPDILSGNDYTLAKHLGFRGENLIPAFWELVPYSWVVDYFTTVGGYLEDTFQVLPGTMYYSGYTKRYELNAYTNFYWQIQPDWMGSPISGSSHVYRVEFSRTPSGSSLPHIGLRFKSMDEVGFMGVTKLLNLASVLIQRKL
jgi:hypothetical protein